MADVAPTLDLGTHAAAYARAGYEVFPLNADKTPRTKNGMLDATTDPAQIEAWWRQWPASLIGCRIPEDVVLLDVDPRHRGGDVWRALKDEHGEIPLTRRHMSGRRDGGGHVWFRKPAGRLSIAPLVAWAVEHGLAHVIEGTEAKPKHTAGIDLLHHGHRYTILPPSPHAATGQPYEWRGDQDTPILPMPVWLERLVTEPELQVNGNHPDLLLQQLDGHAAAPPAAVDGDSIADWYTASTTWAALLGRAGWTLVRGDGETDGSLWRHPAATAKYSASVKHGCLFIHSPNTPFEETTPGAPNGYTRFHAYAELHHAGDASAAARAARELKDGPILHVDLEGLIAPTNGAPAASALLEWREPTPLERPVQLPEFPLHILPSWILDQAVDVARQLQVPIDLPALLGIGALAAAVAGKAKIRVVDGWTSHLNLYIAIAMPPSSGKSPAAKAMLAPLEKLERELIDSHAQIVAEAEQRKRIAEKRAKQLEDKAAKTGDPKDAMDAVQAALAAQAAEVPPSPRLLADDATPEALQQVLAHHGGRVTIASTEGGLFELMTGRYSDGKANLDVYLKSWSSDSIREDRIGRPPIHIPEPVLSVLLTVQPDVIRALADRPELAGRGLTARFLYALPVDLVGRRDLRAPRGADAVVRLAYNEQLIAIGRRCASWAIAPDLRLDEAAQAMYGDWRHALEQRRLPDGDLRPVAEWTGKLEACVLRLAGLLHLAEGHATDAPVAAAIVAKALVVADYWLAHARAVHDMWGGDKAGLDVAAVLEWLRRKAPARFTARDVELGVNRLRGERDRVEGAVEKLVELGWIRPVDGGPLALGKRPGRSAQKLEGHPETRARSREVADGGEATT